MTQTPPLDSQSILDAFSQASPTEQCCRHFLPVAELEVGFRGCVSLQVRGDSLSGTWWGDADGGQRAALGRAALCTMPGWATWWHVLFCRTTRAFCHHNFSAGSSPRDRNHKN